MASLPAINVSGYDLNTPHLAKAMSHSSISRRPSSLKHPMRSSTSRISLVGDNGSLEPKIDVMYGTTNNAKEFGWFDHLLGVFCIARRPRFESVETTVSRRAPDYNEREDYFDSRSPWVLPVYVLSTERDEHRHLIPKEAKGTIDTGNLQGNLVSRAFLVDVLRYSEADFHELTNEEKDGGTGITGHRLIPEGAISLTWYHSNSTRVFRDMRFLISEHPTYDLIIGAHSIRQNNILDVPNLMADQDPAGIILSIDPLKMKNSHG
ncbi:hypothetical protein L207DRAFT_333477 [Hyaloscypha variabilis F]|uniref:Uncharacterized protein n=1 Tax=Hyaloscypha variabilis (strain UAMH 11265 / GT02V1 / F) TaxID=1149755 RepID=A0A2J6RTR5_HYAVF|nr:hypothetical protein L207DRAFT_333477 [Hyaloscypha variabilis F]